jgi:hypothetical protein
MVPSLALAVMRRTCASAQKISVSGCAGGAVPASGVSVAEEFDISVRKSGISGS